MNQLRTFAGEIVDCDLELPELSVAPAGAEVTIRIRTRRGEIPRPTAIEDGERFDADGGFTFRVPPIATIRLVPGWRDVEVFREPDAADGAVRHAILDHVLPRRLALVGRVTLHGTCVSIDGRALAFVAESHQGKSTLSAALAQRGGHWLADDCLVVDHLVTDDATLAVAIPTFTGTRLWPDSSLALGLPEGQGEIIDERITKQRWSGSAGVVACDAVPLAGIMLVQRGEAHIDPALERLSGGAALKVLGAHWFLAYSVPPIDFLHKAAKLLASVPVYRLSVPGSLDRLDEVVDMLIAHFVSPVVTTAGRG